MERACAIFDRRVYCTQQGHGLRDHTHGRFAECRRQQCVLRNEVKTPHFKDQSEEWSVLLSRVAHDTACCRPASFSTATAAPNKTKHCPAQIVSSSLSTRNGITCPACVSLPNNFKQNAYILVCLKTYYMYHQFNIQQFYVLPHTAVFMCFVWISEQTAIISLYSINWLVCITETEVCLLRGTDWVFKCNACYFLSVQS